MKKDGRSASATTGASPCAAAQGALIMDRLDLFKSKSYVTYEPALRVLPAEIDSADAVVRQTGYKMYSVETGKLKRAGRVTHCSENEFHHRSSARRPASSTAITSRSTTRWIWNIAANSC